MKYENVQLYDGQVSIPIAESYKDCIELIRSDYYRFSRKRVSLFRMWVTSLYSTGFTYNFWLRLSSYKGWLFPVCRFFLFLASEHTHIHISYKTRIGYGLYLGHGVDMIVNPLAVIGNNCNLSQFLSIGSNTGHSCIIGDNVYVGPHVCIVEDVKIGNNATIGAGAVVIKDIPDNATAVGVPAKIISFDKPAQYIFSKYERR
jgi:serine O-acetyltransferase